MESRRLLELAGAFLLGAGVLAIGYELGGPGRAGAPAGESEASPNPADEVSRDVASPTAGTGDTPGGAAGAEAKPAGGPAPTVERDIFGAAVPFGEAEEAKFPQHGVVTSLAVVLRERAEVEGPMLGILRSGTRFRSDRERTFGGGCTQGWNRVFPAGFVCRNAGVAIEESPPDFTAPPVPVPNIQQELPYEYLRVKDEMTPFFHRLPSFGEQDQADVAGRAWLAKNGRTPMPTAPSERPKDVPAVVKEYMNAGYYVTKAGEEVKSERRFVRTVRGSYARKYQVMAREASEFHGVEVGGDVALPLHFIRREMPFMKREAEGSDVLVKTDASPKRLTLHPFVRKIFIGNSDYFEDEEGRLYRAYGVSLAQKTKRPPGIGPDERWVHIDLSEQALVAYVGSEPVFATMVSTGKEPGMTPIGIHRVQSKHISTSMRDQPPEEEAYSIEDVPWTQYFDKNVALHGAFWHSGFGLVRSHGCVNLSPTDAKWLFGFTTPKLPETWHAVFADVGQNGRGSAVVITE